MPLFRKFFYKKPPDGLLEIGERVYVFDCCFTTKMLEDDEYRVYVGGIVGQLRDHIPEASLMVFNFREGESSSQISNILSEYDMTVMDYPRHYEGCPLLTMEMIHHFLKSSENWLSLVQQNVLLMHCERGGWPVLVFMLASLLIYRKQYSGEQKTLDMIYKQAPCELLHLMSALNPLPSQVRYLQYVSRRNVGSQWPPLDRALTLDCIILRVIPNFDGEGGCRPIFRIYGKDPLMVSDRTAKVLFSTPKRSKLVRHFKQADCELVKIDIHCYVQGDVVLECITLDANREREEMMFRVMFNTSFVRSNILILNREEIDILWNAKNQFPKDFRAEVIFSEMDVPSFDVSADMLGMVEKDGLPEEEFAKFKETFSNVDWLVSQPDIAVNVLQHVTAANILQENLEIGSPRTVGASNLILESAIAEVKDKAKSVLLNNNIQIPTSIDEGKEPTRNTFHDGKPFPEKVEPMELQVALHRPALSKIISQRVPRTSLSAPVAYSSSMQGSPVPLSKYHSAPSALGITALLHDHVTSTSKEVNYPVTLSIPSPINTPIQNGRKLQCSKVLAPLSQPPPPLPLTPTSPLVQSSIKTPSKKDEISATPSSSLPFTTPTSKATSSLITKHPEMQSRRPSPSIPLPPPLPSFLTVACSIESSYATPSLLTPQPISSPIIKDSPTLSPSTSPPEPPLSERPPSSTFLNLTPPPPPPPPRIASLDSFPVSSPSLINSSTPTPGPPPPPPFRLGSSISGPIGSKTPVPPPPPQLGTSQKDSKACVPPVPPPPAPFNKKSDDASPESHRGVCNRNIPPIPGPPSAALFSAKGRGPSRTGLRSQTPARKTNLKPYHWLKLTRAMQGSLWAETQKADEDSKAPEFDMLELEHLFSAAAPDEGSKGGRSNLSAKVKTEKVQLIDHRRAYNCEIMLSKIKIPLPDLMSSVLCLDDSALDVDQVDNLIKFCPTKEEIDLLKSYNGDMENLGKCEQFFLELMKVLRVESKLRVFSFKMQFFSQASDLRKKLSIINAAAEEVRNSVKLKRIMQTILSLGNALNHGTARGSAIGFRLDSLLKLTDIRARNNRMTLMHYLCKVLAEKLPELLDFTKDLVSLEAATKIQLKCLAEEMQAISKGLEKVVQELTASESDGSESETFCKILKEFLSFSEGEVRSLASLYSNVGRNADALALYFGEDPARVPFEQVVSTLLNFVRAFGLAHNENCKQLEFEKKKALKDAGNKMFKIGGPRRDSENIIQSAIKSGNA